ncbi:hypothetical protein [Streptomyces murinus]|uniref:Helicase ATP-binding domain-containing protein n=1 Tax=Streptomyces murinus TaxID=33900 RepID=A0A7W3NU93_STRMR|nr:hypothetical protein [Streptomyces murinus]MBA9056823.1 hypothetical protein [Streptomyces murinus]UWW91238.1 hypothetical protein GO605_10465 [Streptomyces murinus]
MGAAVGLAASFFHTEDSGGFRRTTTRGDVLFVLDGHIADWSGWRDLSDADARRFTKLLRRRPNQLANAEAASTILDSLLGSGQIPGCSAIDDGKDERSRILVDPGMPMTEFVDGFLRQLDDLFRQKPRVLQTARTGPHTTTTRVTGPDGRQQTFVDFHYEIRSHHADPGHPIPSVRDSPALLDRCVPFSELKEVATLIDEREREQGRSVYRANAVDRFITQIRSRKDENLEGLDLTAGSLNELLAYTGFGKSVVLIETFACWAIRRAIPVALVLPTNADVIRAVHAIERAVELCGYKAAGGVVPLISPRSLIKVAETAAARVTENGPDADWIWRRLGYGCAIATVADSEDAVDRWQPGSEPCARLRKPSQGRRKKNSTVACPWRTTCGRYRAAREACTADVIVTSHANLLLGVLQTPVEDGYGEDDRLTVEELLLRRCQILVIDEVDVFQSTAIDHAGRHLVLDHAGRTNTPLRKFDQDFAAAFGRLQDEVDAGVRDAYFTLRYLSENYVSHLTYERLGATTPVKGRRPRGPGRYWMVPRRWDSWLTARLFALDDEKVSAQQLAMFRSLFLGEEEPQAGEPETFQEARHHLASVVTGGSGGLSLPVARVALERLVKDVPEEDRTKVVNRILRRAILERIRLFLHRLMANNAQLVDIGVESAQEIADALGTYGRWRVMPTGPLGRLVFAFTEYYDDTGGDPARLSTAAFGGDPHSYTVRLGDTTALAHTGVRRIVLGMSATSYFPGAPHHHIHTTPKWHVADQNPETVRILAAPIEDEQGRPRRISGLDGPERTMATQRIAMSMWGTYLRPELERLKAEEPGRARVLLATTSYAAARHVAEGLSAAGVDSTRICLAVRPGVYTDDQDTAVDVGRWRELPADRLESFPAIDGADILIAPLGRVQRGVNIIGEDDKSALGSVWLIVRPIPLIDEPAELVAHIQARALTEYPGPSGDPQALLAERRSVAGRYLEEIVRRPPYFQAQPWDVKLGVVAEIINGAVQLIGRARRGGTKAVLHLVDGALLDDTGGSDLATLVLKLRDKWQREGVLAAMHRYYGTTLEAFLEYAEQVAEGGRRC